MGEFGGYHTIKFDVSSFSLKYCKISITIRSVEVVPIGHRFNNINRNINSIIPNTRSSNLLSSNVNSNEDELSGHHTVYIKDVTSVFYYFNYSC
ncbi:hypothetical protein PIROE2DRAFT_18835 [Piromyces sp. E2]|nr:hypothetical protein PIROE2DRAFT_18835 [Piromyces sp. E2]|eukprot:OUM56527.1 hypothetical protein PIROE2DRAFT_18835 [Piromyces sp. E2]